MRYSLDISVNIPRCAETKKILWNTIHLSFSVLAGTKTRYFLWSRSKPCRRCVMCPPVSKNIDK
jgi:hypothetical protein